MAFRRVLGPVVVVVAAIGFVVPAQASGSIESQVFALINGSRSTALIHHSGLASAARSHSQHMAVVGGLNHDGADERVANAQPDPVEANGAPDDGFARAAWCENVTYSTGFPESQVAQKLYQQWKRSASHNGCMTNSAKNVGAVGVYYDGSTWWATFIAEIDHTPPGGAAPQRSQPPAPAPRATTKPPADRPAPGTPDFTGPPAPVTNISVPAGGSVSVPAVPGRVSPSIDMPLPVRATDVAPGGPLAQAYQVGVGHISGTSVLTRATRGEFPAPDTTQAAGLACIGLFALRRLSRRTRARNLRRLAAAG